MTGRSAGRCAAGWTVVLLVLGGCAGDRSGSGAPQDDDVAQVEGAEVEAAEFEIVDVEIVEVVEVVDGDTLRVLGSDGEERVRLIGVNAPEVGECFHDEATAVLRELTDGEEVRLARDQSDRDRFDRLLRFVETLDGDDVNAELVRSGAARSQRFEPDVSRNDRYDELQAEARTAGRGLWASDACGASAVPDDVRIGVELQFDAPGDDDLDLNGEWVRFTNLGDGDLDLTGWQVTDESSSHRYRFDRLVLAPGGSVTLFTGCGTDGPGERFWCNELGAVWNNAGDTVYLQDPQGNVVVAESYRG